MRYATAGATLGLVAALTVVGTGLSDDEGGQPVESVADRPALPLGSPTPGYAGAEDTALELATNFGAVESAPGQACPADQLAVSWDDPGADYETGAHYAPVGPRPEGNETANGVVFCDGFDYDYTGFNINWDGTRWNADLAPDFGDDGEGPADPGHDDPDPDAPVDPSDPTDPTTPLDPNDPDLPDLPGVPGIPAPSGPTDLIDRIGATVDEISDIADLELTDPWQGIFDEFAIEDLAGYEPQSICSPSPKAGTYGFSELLVDTFPSTGSSGISRGCDVGGRSEHKEGRAFDWSALVTDEADARAASQVIGWLLATDEHGEPYAMARRLGVMYIIYNQSIWRSYAPEQGWVGYTGPNPHTDHVHFSFDHAGGEGDTSFWEVAELPDVSALDFGPYALLPDAGGVSVDGDQPAVQYGDVPLPGSGGGGRPGRPNRPHVPVPGGGGGDARHPGHARHPVAAAALAAAGAPAAALDPHPDAAGPPPPRWRRRRRRPPADLSAGHAAAAPAPALPAPGARLGVSITAAPPSAEDADPDDRRSAWYAASRRRLGLAEDVWYDPAVEHVLEALARHEPIDEAVTELGSARGVAGFDLRETASDLDALAEVLPREDAQVLADRATVAALSAWADAFIDRVHPPACVDAMTGLVTLGLPAGPAHRGLPGV